MNCEMCGKETENLFIAGIEGTNLKLCKECAKYGKIVKRIKTREEIKEHDKKQKQYIRIRDERQKEQGEIISLIVPNYAEIVKSARERKNLKQEQVAKMIKEKESVIHQVESGHLEPSIKLARKFEALYHLNLIEEINEKDTKEGTSLFKGRSKELTVGDVIKIKERKKR